MTLEAVRAGPTTLADHVAFQIQKAILGGELPPGRELVQDELCEELGVSRTPVREAFRRLEAQQLIELRANRTAVVRGMRRDEVLDLYEIRAELEGFACERAASRISSVQKMDLETAQVALDTTAGVLAHHTPVEGASGVDLDQRLREANERFHMTILVAAQSELLTGMVVGTWNRFPKDYVWRTLVREEDVWALHTTEHRAVIDAVASGDPRDARSAMQAHVLHSGRLLVDYLDRQNYWPTESEER